MNLSKMTQTKDPRYPHTHAYDYIRGLAGYNADGTILARAEASDINDGLAVVLGITSEELAAKIADYYLANEKEITERQTTALIKAIRY